MHKDNFELKDLDDAVLKLAALGLLEIAGKSFRAEFEASYPGGEAGAPPQEKVEQLQRAIKRQERRESFRNIQKVIVPVITKVAVVFLVFFLGFSTVLITSADAREFFYQLVFTVHDRYSEVVIPENHDEEVPKSCYEYNITYIPDGYEKTYESVHDYMATYEFEQNINNFITISMIQLSNSDDHVIRFDTEDADTIQPIVINDSLGLLIEKQGDIQIVWQNSWTWFSVVSNLPSETVIRIAQGIL